MNFSFDKQPPVKRSVISLDLPTELRDRLSQIAERERVSPTAAARILLRAAIEEYDKHASGAASDDAARQQRKKDIATASPDCKITLSKEQPKKDKP